MSHESAKEWIYDNVTERAEELSKAAGISTLLAKVFINRGKGDVQYIKKFLNPSLDELYDPFLMKDMDKAAERIIKAIENKESVVIYGDYDVDGITSTSILYTFLNDLGINVSYYIPDRLTEGYGMNIDALSKIAEKAVDLVITVDCGITSFDEVSYLKEKGIDIVITDHHECKDTLPEAYAVVDPCREDCPYPFKELAGVGVVFKLINALCIKMNLGNKHMEYLDLVALGTVADVVSLTDENRIIVKYGTDLIQNTKNIGLKTLINVSGLMERQIDSWSIGFGIAPRINAAGRLGDASRAVKLFVTKSSEEALSIALELNEDNRLRQDMDLSIYNDALKIIEEEIDLNRQKVIVVAKEGWHHGIVGIVASKLVERFYRPCILISIDDGVGKGSGRSIEGFNIFEALGHCDDLLLKYGGHELAAGLTISPENINAFRSRINEYADEVLTRNDLIPKIRADARIQKSDISLESVRQLEALSPFGPGNQPPLFVYDNLTIVEQRVVGKDKNHLRLKLDDNGFQIDAIGFNMGEQYEAYEINDRLDVLCSLEINTWNQQESVQMKLKDIRTSKAIQRNDYFFYSLDSCLTLVDTDNVGEAYFIKGCVDKVSGKDLYDEIIGKLNSGEKIAILLNSLKSLNILENELAKRQLKISQHYEVCFKDCSENSSIISIIVNPLIKEYNNDLTVFYGNWIDEKYLNRLREKVLGEVIYHDISFDMDFDISEIVPDRNDLAAVYRLIKAKTTGQAGSCNVNNTLMIDDMFKFSKETSRNYNVRMNYFKLKKCLEIFKELEIIKILNYDKYGMEIALSANKQKMALESSNLYRKLQTYKGQSA